MTAKLFENGRSQAVRLPKEDKWSGFLNSLNLFSEDFMDGGRGEGVWQKREEL